MYTIEKFYENEIPFRSKLLDFYLQNDGNKKIACLDIETTGLSPENSKFILGALLKFQENGYLLKQYFADTLDEEREILVQYIKEIEKIDILLTYNGKNFDIKYLKSKIERYGLFSDFIFPFNLDLYLFINNFSQLRRFLPNLKQKTVENFMGIWDKRSDKISGAESISRYYNYLTSKDGAVRDEILLHNSDDVLQLARIMPILDKIELSKAFFNLSCPLSFAISNKIKIAKKSLIIAGDAYVNSSYHAYTIDNQPCVLKIDRISDSFRLELPTLQKSDMHILNLNNIDADFSALNEYENFSKGYLLLNRNDTVYEKSIIHALKIIFHRIENLMA